MKASRLGGCRELLASPEHLVRLALAAVIYFVECLGLRCISAKSSFRAFVAEDLSADVEDGGEVFRLEVAAQFVDHVYENICCRYGCVARGHGPLPLHRMVGGR